MDFIDLSVESRPGQSQSRNRKASMSSEDFNKLKQKYLLFLRTFLCTPRRGDQGNGKYKKIFRKRTQTDLNVIKQVKIAVVLLRNETELERG